MIKPKVIIIGTSIFSEDICQIIQFEQMADVLAYCTYQAFMDICQIGNLPVVAFEELSSRYDMSNVHLLNTIGYSKMNIIREKVFEDCIKLDYQIYTYISPKAIVYTDCIGLGSIIMPNAYIGPNVFIGKANIIWNNVALTHRITIGDFNFICANCTIGGNVNIKNNCFLGLNATIKNGVVIADRTLIGSSSNVLHSTELGLTYVGNPAKCTNRKSIDVLI